MARTNGDTWRAIDAHEAIDLFETNETLAMARDRKVDDARLAAARASQAWKEKTERRLSSFEDSPMFGGNRQAGLFGPQEGK